MNVEKFYNAAGISLTLAGTRWKSLCPFHKEDTPSFIVYSDGSYHCFGCKAHGTAKTIQELYDLDYRPYPDIIDVRNDLLKGLAELKNRTEIEFNLLILDCNMVTTFRAYDLFDRLFVDARALADDINITLLDLTAFIKMGFEKICKRLQNQLTKL